MPNKQLKKAERPKKFVISAFSRLMEEGRAYDKSAFYLSRHSSFMIMHTFADWGRVRHNRAENLGITTV